MNFKKNQVKPRKIKVEFEHNLKFPEKKQPIHGPSQRSLTLNIEDHLLAQQSLYIMQ